MKDIKESKLLCFCLWEAKKYNQIYLTIGLIWTFISFYFWAPWFNSFQANDNAPSYVTTGIAACPNELFVQPESFLDGKFKNIISYNDMERCGHFAAYEEPKLIADDVFSFVEKVERLNVEKMSAKKELWNCVVFQVLFCNESLLPFGQFCILLSWFRNERKLLLNGTQFHLPKFLSNCRLEASSKARSEYAAIWNSSHSRLRLVCTKLIMLTA